ncbi:hypothetical protein AB6A40_004631 [Gnathostoma spinigerum]|uniref:C-type lectin domain-containing protein n=1 Tax=Gnathostoma spinigerum TaxID=75299 RepID=A0ABD6EF82_9BILA
MRSSLCPTIQILTLSLITTLANTQITQKQGECPRNWIKYTRTQSCFFIIQSRLKWSEAEKVCAQSGAHLASIVDEYENSFVFEFAKRINLSVPTLWLGRLVQVTENDVYKWSDGLVGQHISGFRSEPSSGTDICLTMWLDFDRAEGSWIEWDCNYSRGYSAICKKAFKNRNAFARNYTSFAKSNVYYSRRCCLSVNCVERCSTSERCIPDDLNCWAKKCTDESLGWCLPVH